MKQKLVKGSLCYLQNTHKLVCLGRAVDDCPIELSKRIFEVWLEVFGSHSRLVVRGF